MKILDKTIFRGKNKEIKNLTETQKNNTFLLDKLINESRDKDLIIKRLQEQLDELNKVSAESIAKVMMENTKLKDKLAKTEKLRRKNAGAIGGLKKDNNKLLNKIVELNQNLLETKREFSEFREGKYIVKELKPEKVPRRRQVMNVKSGAITSRIIAKVRPNEVEEEKQL